LGDGGWRSGERGAGLKVIYHGPDGTHASTVAAAIHLGRLPEDRVPDPSALTALEGFHGPRRPEPGRLAFQGVDPDGHQVYVLGREEGGDLAERALTGVGELFGIDRAELVFVNTEVAANGWLRLGGVVSRLGGGVGLGRLLVTRGAWRAYPELARLVRQTRERIRVREARAAPAGDEPEAGPAARGVPDPRRPKVIFHCYGSAHTSVVAASVYLGILPRDRPPRLEAIAALPYFDRVDQGDIGRPFFMGLDDEGREVYVLGLEGLKVVLRRAIHDLLEACGVPRPRLLMADSLHLAEWRTRVGGFLSRRAGLVRAGRPLALAGVLSRYPDFIRFAAETRERARRELSAPEDPPQPLRAPGEGSRPGAGEAAALTARNGLLDNGGARG